MSVLPAVANGSSQNQAQSQSLPALFPRSNAPPSSIYLVKPRAQLLTEVSALEGLVARDMPQIYASNTANDMFWFTYTMQNYGLKYTQISDTSVLQTFKSYVTDSNGKVKIILYASNDPISPAQSNMAVTLAGVYGALPVASNELSTVQSVFGSSNLETLYNLQGMFSSKITAYQWLWNQVGSQVTRSFVSTTPDGGQGMADYIVQHKSFDFEFTNSGSMNSAEQSAATTILSNYPKGTPVMGFFGFGFEPNTITFLSQLGLFMTPSDSASNLSFFSGLPEAMNLKQVSPAGSLSYSSSKVYLAITYSQGNSLGYMFNGNRMIWDDKDSNGKYYRQEIPENFQINPTLAELAPPVLQYWYSTMYSDDYFVAATSGGAGYVHPDQLPNLATYISESGAFSNNAGISVYTIDPGVHKVQTSLYQQFITGTGATAIMTKQPHGGLPSVVNGAPVFQMTYKVDSITSFGSSDVTSAANSIISLGKSQHFIWVFMNAKNPGQGFLQALLSKLGPNYVAVRADQFTSLYLQSK